MFIHDHYKKLAIEAIKKDFKNFNADCNGALNILRKSSVVDLSVLYSRGELDTPKRIRIS